MLCNRSRRVYLWLVLIWLLASACDALPSTASSGSSPTSSVAVTPSALISHQPKTTPTAIVNKTQYNGQVKAYLGSGVSAFRALYRPHGDMSQKGTIIWTLSKTAWFTITFDDSNNHVYDLDHYFYPATQL